MSLSVAVWGLLGRRMGQSEGYMTLQWLGLVSMLHSGCGLSYRVCFHGAPGLGSFFGTLLSKTYVWTKEGLFPSHTRLVVFFKDLIV